MLYDTRLSILYTVDAGGATQQDQAGKKCEKASSKQVKSSSKDNPVLPCTVEYSTLHCSIVLCSMAEHSIA